MVPRRWHVEHTDGREYTQGEWDRMATRWAFPDMREVYEGACLEVTVNAYGELRLRDAWGVVHYLTGHDMVVVWDV